MPTDKNIRTRGGLLQGIPFRLAWLGVCCALTMPSVGLAQEVQASADLMVRCFAAAYAVGEQTDECEGLVPGAIAVLTNPDEYKEYLDGVMSGLEELALTHPEFRVRAAAAVYLMAPGNRALVSENPPGVIERVQRLYDRSDEVAVRSALIRWMPYQAEQNAATAFLETTAKSNRSPAEQMWPEEMLAIDALARMGENGRVVLQRLSDSGLVQNQLARQRLHYLRDEGYRLPRSPARRDKR